MDVSNIDRRRTESLVDELCHDAGVVGQDEHVKSRAGLASSDATWKNRNDGTGGEVAREVGGGLVRELGLEVIEHVALAAGVATVAPLGYAAALGAAAGHGALMFEAWAKPSAKGDDINARAHNDAVNVALAQNLAFDSRFGQAEAASRPGVTNNTAKITSALNGKDAQLKPVLQARADEGFCAAERALDATKSVPVAERGAAVQKWLADNGYGDRMRSDVAFGKGFEYKLWTIGTKGVDADAESKKVHERQAPPQPVVTRG